MFCLKCCCLSSLGNVAPEMFCMKNILQIFSSPGSIFYWSNGSVRFSSDNIQILEIQDKIHIQPTYRTRYRYRIYSTRYRYREYRKRYIYTGHRTRYRYRRYSTRYRYRRFRKRYRYRRYRTKYRYRRYKTRY